MELWDLFDKNRLPLGKTIARGKKMPEGAYRTVVHICIFNSNGEMLIQHRQPFKKGFPDMWDVSVGGSAIAGETSAEAAEREAGEELGISLPLKGTRPRLTVNFSEGFDDIYIVEKDLDISSLTLQYEEVQEVKWAKCDEILAMIDAGAFIPVGKKLIELLFDMREYNGIFEK